MISFSKKITYLIPSSFILICTLFIYLISRKIPKEEQEPIVDIVGQTVPDFSTINLNGDSIHVKDYRGKIMLLNFFATW